MFFSLLAHFFLCFFHCKWRKHRMNIAIPLFGTRVSPRFAFAPRLMTVRVEEGALGEKTMIETDRWSVDERIDYLARQRVDMLICGGIDCAVARRLRQMGIRLYSWVSGEADDALQGHLQGELECGYMMGGGGRCCGRWQFRGRGCACSGSNPPWAE
jgi:predicted Fe-Mo cluster-binding NifX family protein